MNMLELLPIAFVGLICGFASFFFGKSKEHDDENDEQKKEFNKKVVKRAIISAIYSSIICIISYLILIDNGLGYRMTLGISALISLLGIDRALDIARELLSYRNGGGDRKERND